MLTATAWSCWLLLSVSCLTVHALSRQVPRVPARALELGRWLALQATFGPSAAVYMALVLPIWLLVGPSRHRLFLEVLGLPALLLAGPQLALPVALALASALQLLWLLGRLASPPLGWRAPFEDRPRLRSLARMLTACLVLGAPLWAGAELLGLSQVPPWQYATLLWLLGLAASPWRPRGPVVPLPARPRPDRRRWAVAGAALAGLGAGWLLAAPRLEAPLAQVLRPLGGCVAGDVVLVPPGVEVDEIQRLSPVPLRIFVSRTLPTQAPAWPWLGLLAALLALAWLARQRQGRQLSLAVADDVTIELGRELAHNLPGPLQEEVVEVRQWLAHEVGLTLPGVACRLNPSLPAQGYRILVREQEAGAGEVRAGEFLAVTPITARILEELEGSAAFGLPGPTRCGIWTVKLERARELGLRLRRAEELVASHLRDVLQRRAHQLLGLEQVEELLERHQTLYPAQVAQVREVLPLVDLTALLREVLKRRGSLRDLRAVLQTVLERAPQRLADVVAAGSR